MVMPSSRFSKTTLTGVRELRNVHAPLTLPGTLSTAGHCDQSRFAMICAPSFRVRQRVQENRHVRNFFTPESLTSEARHAASETVLTLTGGTLDPQNPEVVR